MKSRILAGLLLLSCWTFAGAEPYFRRIDLSHPQVSAGVWADPAGNGQPAFGSAVAIFTHSTRDGSLFKSIQADWSPLAIGGGYGSGQAFMAVGPSANLCPAVKNLAVKGLDLLDKEGHYANLRQLLAPVPGGGPDINIAFGPQILTMPIEDGTFLPMNRYRIRFRVFAGAAWTF